VSGGLHGVGASVVNALSEWLEVQVHKDGKIYEMKFARGKVTQEMTVTGDTEKRGTMVTFKPDPEMFTDTTVYDYDILHTRMREEAFLNAGLRIHTIDQRPGREQHDDMCYAGGIREFVTWLNRAKTPIHTPASSICPDSGGTPWPSWPSNTPTATARPSYPSPTTSTPPRAACTRPASSRPSPPPSTPMEKR
jgi:DNA gyrase/topoisomerase IV subunit B